MARHTLTHDTEMAQCGSPARHTLISTKSANAQGEVEQCGAVARQTRTRDTEAGQCGAVARLTLVFAKLARRKAGWGSVARWPDIPSPSTPRWGSVARWPDIPSSQSGVAKEMSNWMLEKMYHNVR